MATTSDRPTILLVDDEPTNLKLLREILRADYELLFARNCAEMFQYVVEQPDLILLDVMMPDMDGYAGCAQLQADEATRDIPVIFVTAKSETEDEVRGLEMGAVDYIAKPIQGSVVRARVKTHVALRQAKDIITKQNQALKDAAKLRDDVDRIVRHDLKGPLNAIIGIPGVLGDMGPLNDRQKEFLQMMKESGYLLLDMINRSLDLYKMEQGIYPVDAKPVDILMILNRVFAEVQKAVEKKRLSLRMTLNGQPVASGDIFLVLGEALLCHSMLSNLLKNAVEASPAEESLTIRLEQGEQAVIRIRNKGCVPVEIRDTFFKKYVTFGKRKGTGLGTYSAWMVAKTLGGDIHLDTALEGETSLIIYLIPSLSQ